MEVLSLTVLGLMAGAAALWRLPAAECDQCAHCLAERRERERRRAEELHQQVHATYVAGRCPYCDSDR